MDNKKVEELPATEDFGNLSGRRTGGIVPAPCMASSDVGPTAELPASAAVELAIAEAMEGRMLPEVKMERCDSRASLSSTASMESARSSSRVTRSGSIKRKREEGEKIRSRSPQKPRVVGLKTRYVKPDRSAAN